MLYVTAISYALLLWWISTGLIIVLYRQAPWTYDATFGVSTMIAAASLVAIVLTRHNTETWAIYASFSAGTIVWGWNLTSYYTGFIHGPTTVIPDTPISNSTRFRLAIRSSLYHELVSLALVAVMLVSSVSASNKTGQLTIVLFYVLHQLSKLSIYFGVCNFRGDWLPAHLAYITAFFGPTRNHWFAGIALGVASSIAVWAVTHAVAGTDTATQIAATFWVLLAGVAILEIIVLLIPPAYLHRTLAFLTHLSVAANTKSR
jgi:putative photosynthetic complex assembly protein 2